MRIHRIAVDSFKGVRDRTVEFPDTGITVLQGRNESGKSSLIEAFDLLLEIPDSSGAKAVKAADPVGDDLGIAVEAEFTLEGHRLLYRKQWLKAKKTTLRFLEGPRAGDTLSGREAHDTVMALRERSDQTLWSALRMLQGSASGRERLTDSSALKSALEQASGGSAQSESGSSLLALAQAERERYWTAGGKENAATKAVRDRHAQAMAAHESAASVLAGLDAAQERLERDERALGAAQRTLEAAEEDAEQARVAAASLTELEERRDRAVSDVQAAGDHAEQRRLDLEQRTQLRTGVREAADRAEQLSSEAEALQAKVDTAQEEAQKHRDELQSARTAEEQARQKVRTLRTAQRLVQDRQRLDELTQLLQRLQEVAQQLEALGQAPESPLTQKDIERIDAAERDVATARAQVQAGSAELTVTALGGARSLQLGGEALELPEQQTQTWAVTEQIELELPGQLRVTVAPEQGREDRRRAVEDAQESLQRALQPWDLESPQAARDLLREQTEAQRERQALEHRRQVELAQHDEAELRREHDRLSARLEEAEAPAPAADAQEAADAVQEAEEAAEEARSALESVRDDFAGAEAALSARREELGAARAGQAAQSETARSAEQRLAQERERLSDDALEAAHRQAAAELERAEQLKAQLEQQWQDQDGEHKRSQYQARMRRPEALRQQLEMARDQRAQSKGALMALDRDQKQSAFDDALTQRRAVSRELSTHLRRAAAAKMLADTMERFQAEAHRRYTEPFRRRLEQLGSFVFGSSFRVELDEDLEVTRRFMHGTWIDESSLSTGAREQLAVLVRLAVATLVDPVEGVPVIFDDALGHSDPERLASLAAALESAGRQAQIILLTATPERFAAIANTTLVRIGD